MFSIFYFEFKTRGGTMESRFLCFITALLFSYIQSVDMQTSCDPTNNANVAVVVDIPTTTYIYECQNTTLYLAMANVTFKGVKSDGTAIVVYGFKPTGTTVTITPLPLGAASTLSWDISTYNTCLTITNTQYTVVNCQYIFQVSGFGGSGYLDYESIQSSNFAYSARLKMQSTSGTCPWQILSNVTVEVKDCNEYPVIDPSSIPSIVSIPEYSGTNKSYAGAIATLLVTDPDVFNLVYGNVTLSIVSVKRPQMTGTPGVDPTPFYIDGYNFLNQNNNNSILRYDVARCPVVDTCLAMFDALYDHGGAAPYWSEIDIVIQAIDGGGLKVQKTIKVNITQVPQSPVFLNLPGSVSIVENIVGPLQIYPIQITIPRLGSNTWSIQILNIDPPVNASGGSYVTNTSNCYPTPSLPVLCSGLNLTGSVTGTTFDYLTVNKYNVTVWAINIPPANSGLQAVTVSSSIIVNILPMNKQPILIPSTDAVALTEDVVTQACIYNLSSIPRDPNNDTTFYYTYINASVAAGSNNMWYLNGTQICYNGLYASVGTCCNRVFRSTYSPYKITIQIKDPYSTPTPFPTFTLTVSIIKVDDPPILLAPTVCTVPETWTNFSFKLNATQNYPSSGTTQLLFNVTGISSTYNNQFFYIVSQNSTINAGNATVAAMGPGPYHFNFLTIPIIYCNVSVTDGIYTVQSTVIIYVQYVNRIPLVLNLPNTTTLSETTTGYAPFYTVLTYDNESDPRTFQFVNTSNKLTQTVFNYFSIDLNLGVIYYIFPSFDWFVTNVYTLAVLVKDNPSTLPSKNASSLVNLTVVLNMVNRAPNFTNPSAGSGSVNSTISILENVTGQAFIYTFRASDRENDTIYYNVTAMRPIWNTALNLAWGASVLEYNSYYSSTKPMFNSSIIPVYWIVVECKDVGHMTNATSTTTLTVSIIHVNKSAIFTSLPGYVTIREDVYYGPTDLYTVGAIDPNYLGYPITLSFLGITPTSGSTKFYFNTTTNVLSYVNNPQFSYGIQNSYTALFTATNTILPVATSSIAITIQKINTGPYSNISVYNYTVWLREDTTSGQLLWDLRTRSNQSLSITYSIQDSTPSSGSFVVTSQGLLKLLDKPQFDYTKAPNYVVKVLATDTGLGSGQQAMQVTYTLTVSIISVPKYPVITNLPNFVSIREGYPGAGNIYLTKCRDPGGSTVTWSYNVLPTTGLSYFSISQNGTISTTQIANFTYLLQPQYLVVVMCGNSALTSSSTLTVAIVWTTSTSTTTTTKAPIILVTQTTTQASSSSGLTPEQIGAIAGSLGGALVIAGVAYGIAQAMQKKALADGLTASMKQPVAAVNEINLG